MYRIIVRKSKRIAALALAGALIFGSISVLAEEPEESETPAVVETEESETPIAVETKESETPITLETEPAPQECMLVDETYGIRLEAENTEENRGIFSGITMAAEKYADADTLQYVKENIEPYGEIQAYSVTVQSSNGTAVKFQQDSMPQIYIPIPEEWKTGEVGLFRVVTRDTGNLIYENTASVSEDRNYIYYTPELYGEFTEETITFGIFQKSSETVSKRWKNTVDTFIQYMRFVNWETENTTGGVISRHFFEETASANDVAFVTYYRQSAYGESYYDTYYKEESREVRIPYDVFVKDAKKYYKNVPDLTKINTLEGSLYYDGVTNEFVWPAGGGKGSEALATEIVRVDELGNETYAIRFKVSEKYDITENPDMNDPANYITCTLVVEANENGQWRYVSFLEGYPELKVSLNTSSETLNVAVEAAADKNALLTEEEKESESKIDFILTVEDANSTATEPEKEAILTSAEKLGEVEGIFYLDIDLTKYIDDGQAENITEAGSPITITLGIPAELAEAAAGKDGTYSVIRIHDGVTEALETEYNSEYDTVTFETDRFSTYAITYTVKSGDTPSGDGGNGGSGNNGTGNNGSGGTGNSGTGNNGTGTGNTGVKGNGISSVKTGDEAQTATWILLAMAAVISAVITVYQKGKYRR